MFVLCLPFFLSQPLRCTETCRSSPVSTTASSSATRTVKNAWGISLPPIANPQYNSPLLGTPQSVQKNVPEEGARKHRKKKHAPRRQKSPQENKLAPSSLSSLTPAAFADMAMCVSSSIAARRPQERARGGSCEPTKNGNRISHFAPTKNRLESAKGVETQQRWPRTRRN